VQKKNNNKKKTHGQKQRRRKEANRLRPFKFKRKFLKNSANIQIALAAEHAAAGQ
jgi:hypothetical protein